MRSVGAMRKLVVNTFLTLDGVMQAPGGPEEDPSGGFEHGGWSVNYWDADMEEVMADATSGPFDLLLGRKTYEIFAAHWPYSDDPGAERFNRARKHVASTTLEVLDWENSRLIEGDIAAAIRRLKEEDGPELQVLGSWQLIQALTVHDLVDEYGLLIFPVVLGSGKRLFGEGAAPAGLELSRSKVFSTGVVMATYRRAAGIETGSFALEQPSEAEIQRREALEGSPR